MKTLHFHFYDAGAYDGETEHRIMCNFYSVSNGKVNHGQSQLVLASEWPAYRAHIESNGWSHREFSREANLQVLKEATKAEEFFTDAIAKLDGLIG